MTFLGFDSSTQSLTTVVIDIKTRKIIYQHSLNYDEEFPSYHTKNGTLSNSDPLVVHSSPLLWAEALDRSFEIMKREGVPLHSIVAMSGSAQQHGSVYFAQPAAEILAKMNPSVSLKKNLDGAFSRPTAPIWMDFSTTKECEEIREALGGVQATVQLTGSNTFERFTGPQIRKFYKQEPHHYEQTASIGLVSSYMASLLSGTVAPIDHGDGSGMSLMDIRKRMWAPNAVEATAPHLAKRLLPLVSSSTFIGSISPYFVTKYGLSPHAKILAWSGDNLNSAIGLGLTKEGTFAISLGTSDTYFGPIREFHVDPHGEGHLFLSPTGDYLPIIVFRNGSLAREKVRALYHYTWEQFDKGLEQTPLGNNGALMLPYFGPEIVPHVSHPQVHRLHLSEKDGPANCRAIIEAQMLSMRNHSQWIEKKPQQLFATGGASVNASILQVMANVFQCPVSRIEIAESAALGAALRAAHAHDPKIPWASFAKVASPIKPDPKAKSIYDQLAVQYAEFEQATRSN